MESKHIIDEDESRPHTHYGTILQRHLALMLGICNCLCRILYIVELTALFSCFIGCSLYKILHIKKARLLALLWLVTYLSLKIFIFLYQPIASGVYCPTNSTCQAKKTRASTRYSCFLNNYLNTG